MRGCLYRLIHGQALCRDLQARSSERFGHVDVLVNNAGMSPLYDHVANVSEALYDKVLDVNLKGPFRLTVAWPSGAEQVLDDVMPGRIEVREPAE